MLSYYGTNRLCHGLRSEHRADFRWTACVLSVVIFFEIILWQVHFVTVVLILIVCVTFQDGGEYPPNSSPNQNYIFKLHNVFVCALQLL